jgi:hypothetical protein
MSVLSRLFVHSLATFASVAAIGCKTSTEVTAARIAGQWSRLDGLSPYRFSEDWNLSTSGTAISGTGTWSGEACCGGTVSIAGSFDGNSVHVSVDLVTNSGAPLPPRHYRFDGALVTSDEMVGVATADDSTRTDEHLQKQK